MRSTTLLLVALATAPSLPAPALACSVCGCGDPLLAASDPAAIAGQLRLQLDTEYVRVDSGTEGQPGSTDQLTQWSYRFNVVWRPIDALSLTATLPYVSKSIHTVGGGADVTTSSLSGLGDMELAARWALWTSVNLGARRVQELALSGGSAIPTGAHDARAADGTLVDPHGQLGAGAWGPFAGAHYRLEQGDWSGFASLAYRLRTEASYLDGSRYKFGNALLWSVHAQVRPWRRAALDLGIDGRHAWADRAVEPDGIVTPSVENTGGTVLAVAPGVYVNAVANTWLFVRAQVPVYQRLYGIQDVKPTVNAGVQVQAF